MKLKKFVASHLPVRYAEPFDKENPQRILQTFGLQRSGQHVVIAWICRGFGAIIHLNHCRFLRSGLHYELTPLTGRRVVYSGGTVDDSGIQGREHFKASLPTRRFERLPYSIEDMSLKDPKIQRLDKTFTATNLLILRDPANWLASSIRQQCYSEKELLQKRRIFVEYLEQATSHATYLTNECLTVNYNRFIVDGSYRRHLADELDLASFDAAEQALEHVPRFGGGSSFEEDRVRTNTLERWKHFRDDAFFIQTLRLPRLINLSIEYFGTLPGLNELHLTTNAGS